MRRSLTALISFLGLLAVPLALGATGQAQPGAALGGVVVSTDQQPVPIRRALVTLLGTGAPDGVQVVTDDAGRFVFGDLPAGRFTITVEKPAYLKTFYGSRRVGSGPAMPVPLRSGERVTNLRIPLVRGAAIAGVVVDENGAPLASAQVRAQLSVTMNGERRLVDPPGRLQLATTDELGRFRLYGLPPGDYTVLAVGGGGLTGGTVRLTTPEEITAVMGRLMTPSSLQPAAGASPSPETASAPFISRSGAYLPGVADAASAQLFTLAAGEERTGLTIRSPLVRTARVDGIALGPDGQPIRNIAVGIANASTGSLWSSPGIVRPDPDGHFQITGLLPARYVLFGRGTQAALGSRTPLDLWTETDVVVNGQDVSGVVLQFEPGSSLSGRLVFRGSAPPPDATKIPVLLSLVPDVAHAAVDAAPVAPAADGTFAVHGLAPGRYRVIVAGSKPWYLRSVLVGGRDVLDAPLEIRSGEDVSDARVVFVDEPTELTGTLFDQQGRPTPEFAVVVFPADRSLWTTAPRRMSGLVRPGSDGRFSVTGLPPGDYILSALTDADPAELADPTLLDELARAGIRFTLGEGEQKVQDVRIGGAPGR